ncbi:MAG: HAMP domain-containing sensor histidine kinase [Verrucomicrobia bacterium]|nr:HAMP domain-containing sensor histidine kinase [Verrucomicrobiota bacterium]
METVQRQAAMLARQPLIAELLNSVLNYVLILNQQRQVVFASKNVQELVPGTDLKDLLGKRPGEALGCTHPDERNGCGTTSFCTECGAVKTILASLAGRKDCQECRMVRVFRSEEESLDLLVAGTPLTVEGEAFSLVAITDISHEKRRRALERIFFHDVINSAGGLEGRVLQLDQQVPPTLHEQIEQLRAGVHYVLEEILAQRDLIAAENNELPVDSRPLKCREALERVLQLYAKHPVAENRALRLAPESVSLEMTTDLRLLRRVAGNLIKNALEASRPGQTVTAGCAEEGDAVRFWVHNPAFMPPEVQLQVFNRSFSTKGSGRGLGTYSVKLLTERYLKGKAGFTSSQENGTVFFVILPKNLGPSQSSSPSAG